jgi:SAM-dependent methyltransferase
MTETSMIDFYRRHGISPVRQNIADLEEHFTRRAGLYHHLGLLPAFFRGRSVVEIGPGSGFNSLYTATLEPSRYVLLEGNPTGVADIEALFGDFPELRQRIEIVCSLVQDYASAERFDFVFCEGMLALAGLPDPTVLLRCVARLTALGGVLVITCIDAISYFAETLRRLFAQLLIDPDESLDAQAERLTPIFGPHLSTIDGMNRRHDDWVIDNLLNWASIGQLLPIPTAIAALRGEFEFFAASPHYTTDWRWYKSLTRSAASFGELAIEQYWQNAHNLLDFRQTFLPRDATLNKILYAQCESTRDLIRSFEETRDTSLIDAIRGELDGVERSVRPFNVGIADAVREAALLLRHLPLDGAAVASCKTFASWFGRGQQALSFSRVQETWK